MLELNKTKLKELLKSNGKTYLDIAEELTALDVPTSESAVKSWFKKENAKTPDYKKISLLAEIFNIPSLTLYINGDKELEKNVKLEILANPSKYEKYLNNKSVSNKYCEILAKLEKLDNQKLQAITTILENI